MIPNSSLHSLQVDHICPYVRRTCSLESNLRGLDRKSLIAPFTRLFLIWQLHVFMNTTPISGTRPRKLRIYFVNLAINSDL